MPNEHRQRVIEIVKGFSEKLLLNSYWVRTFVNCYSPTLYDDPFINLKELDTQKIQQIYRDFPYEKIKNIENMDQLLESIYVFYHDKICDPEKFKETILYLSLTNKGLSIPELASLTGLKLQEVGLI